MFSQLGFLTFPPLAPFFTRPKEFYSLSPQNINITVDVYHHLSLDLTIMTNIIIDTSDPPASGQVEKKLYQVKKDPSKAQPFPPRYVPPHRLRPQAQSFRLRGSEVPYGFITTDRMLVKGLDHHLPSGLLKSAPNEEEDVNFSNVRYGGGYTWNGPVMRNQLRSDHKALGEKMFTTPGTYLIYPSRNGLC